MTHPTRIETGSLAVIDAISRISDQEKTEMCLAVNMVKGQATANRLLDLFGAARKQAREAQTSSNE